MAHAYAHLFRLPCTGLRFFTVYGPWGRPDMAPMLFAGAIARGEPIAVFGYGAQSRDFTYIDDIAEGVVRASDRIAAPDPDWDPVSPDPATSDAPFRLYNIGNNAPVPLEDFIAALETALGRPAIRELLPMQPGDVPDTWADSTRLARALNWRPDHPDRRGRAPLRRLVARLLRRGRGRLSRPPRRGSARPRPGAPRADRAHVGHRDPGGPAPSRRM